MKAYSKELREHVLRAVDQGHPRAEIVRLFGVSLASIKRYLKQRRETGDLSPKAIPGRPSKKYAALEAGLVAQLEAHPDSTLEAHCQLWESTHGMWVDHTTMSRAIRRVGWTRKKNLGWQAYLEKDLLQRRKVGSGILTEAQLFATRLAPKGELLTHAVPRVWIRESQCAW